jgi:predicted ATPase/DNA-binding winged helix-turn-helix (wHTH) protein
MERNEEAEPIYRFEEFRLLPRSRQLFRGTERVSLYPKALSVLIVLVERHDRIVSADEILDLAWPGVLVEEVNVPVHVCALRAALGRYAITTFPGRGYRFTAKLELRETEAPDAAARSPEPRAGRPVSNLPRLLEPVIGRETALAEVADRMSRHRLVTLAGPGGIGKTRLAIELGCRAAALYPDGVWLIDLAALGDKDPALVASAAATVLEVPLRGTEPPAEAIAAGIARREMLLIFDNCEYQLDAVAALIEVLLDRAPGLSVLVTSQETLGAPLEAIYRLDPLALPPHGATMIDGFGAVEFFVDRARAADRHFRLDAGNAASVAAICRSLDGIPLALEMAAARLPSLGIERVRVRLDKRLDTYRTRPRTGEPRHRTLRAMMEWSHGLLDVLDRRVFRCLAIFPAGFSLDAGIAIAGTERYQPWEIEDALTRLIDKSLVTVEVGDPPRYRLLESLRLYAREKLEASGESDLVAEEHARYFTDYFVRADRMWESMPDAGWLQLHGPEVDNARTALDWALAEPARARIACGLAGHTARLWESSGLLVEGRSYVDRALALDESEVCAGWRARLLGRAAALWHSSDRQRGVQLANQSAVLCRHLGDRGNLASALALLGGTYALLGRHAEAETNLIEAQAILLAEDSAKLRYSVAYSLGMLAAAKRDIVKAKHYYSQGLALSRSDGSVRRKSRISRSLAEIEFNLGNVDEAIALVSDGISSLQSANDRGPLYIGALANLASYLIFKNDIRGASTQALQALSLSKEIGGYWVRVCLQLWVLLGALKGRHREAARLIGFVNASWTRAGEAREWTEQKIYDRLVPLLEANLPALDIQAHGAEGARWTEQQAVDFAFGRLVSPVISAA